MHHRPYLPSPQAPRSLLDGRVVFLLVERYEGEPLPDFRKEQHRLFTTHPIFAGHPGEGGVDLPPGWTAASSPATTIDVVLKAQAELSTKRFCSASPATPAYRLGLLDLAKPYFSVIDLDVDGAAESLSGLSISLQSLATWHAPWRGRATRSLRRPGPALYRALHRLERVGWHHRLEREPDALAQRQTALQDAVSTWVTSGYQHATPRPAEPPLPVLQAEDIIRGHRFDVHSQWEPTPAWRSLHQRAGTYTFGTSITTTSQDEGIVVPGASQPATTKGPLPDLYVHESIARWAGWSLSVQRNGQHRPRRPGRRQADEPGAFQQRRRRPRQQERPDGGELPGRPGHPSEAALRAQVPLPRPGPSTWAGTLWT